MLNHEEHEGHGREARKVLMVLAFFVSFVLFVVSVPVVRAAPVLLFIKHPNRVSELGLGDLHLG